MALIANTTRRENHSTLEYRTLWVQTGSVFTYTVQYRTNTTSTWTAVLDAITYPSDLGTGDEMTGKNAVPLPNGWFSYDETWVDYGTWTDVTST